jgi:TatD DNase family protein
MMIDTHCHLDFDAFDADRDAVLDRARAAGVTRIIIPSVDVEGADGAIALAQTTPGVFACVGIHPNSTAGFDADPSAMLARIEAQARQSGIVAFGEIGLDYYRDHSPRETQHRAFAAQLELAARLSLPVIIHNRDASEDTIPMLEAWARDLPPTLRDRPGVLHSVSAPPELVERALAAGFYIGFTGPITYRNADQTRRIAAAAPLERLLVETDAPYLTPTPHRGERNEPAYIPLIVDRLAALHNITADEMAAITTANAVRLFNLPE